MKYQNIILLITFISLTMSSCKDGLLHEITELNLERALSPTGLTAQVVERTGVRLSWKRVNNAQRYNIEIYDNPDFSGEPVKEVEDVSFDQLPYTVLGLEGETTYTVRVRALGEGLEESKWISVNFTTDVEQIFNTVDPETLTATSVTLTWPAGESATEIILMPGEIRHAVTSAEVNAGTAVISGLLSDVTYTATLKNGQKTRGIISFTTLLGEGVTKVSPEDDLAGMIEMVDEGAILALEPGTYTINASLAIKKSLTIQGYRPSDRPLIKGAVFRLSNNSGLILKDLVLDGSGNGSGDQTVIYETASDSPYGDFLMENCDVKYYRKGLYYVNVKARIPAVEFKNNIISNIECDGGDFIDFRQGIADELNFVDNTVYNSAAARDLFRMDSNGSNNFGSVDSKITIMTNTFYNTIRDNTKRYLYIRTSKNSVSVVKNLIVQSDALYTDQNATTITLLSANNYYNAPNFTASSRSNAKNDSGNYTSLNPEFTNPDQGDFTINNIDLKLNGIGASRWR